MTQEEMVVQFEDLTKKMVETMRAKNNDYSGGWDPFKNLRRHGSYGVIVRMDDKISRLDSLLGPKSVLAQVKDESIEDTALDLATYALLLVLLRRDVLLFPPESK